MEHFSIKELLDLVRHFLISPLRFGGVWAMRVIVIMMSCVNALHKYFNWKPVLLGEI